MKKSLPCAYKSVEHAVLSKTESKLLNQINKEFPTEKWERLKYLDWKLEFSALSETEEKESLRLAEAYETYSVERLKALTQLATLRQITIEDLTTQLGFNKKKIKNHE